MRATLLLLISICCSLSTTAQTLDTASLDSYLDTLADDERFMGTVLIQKDSSILYQKAVGYRDIDENRLNTVETVFRLGSISKMLTATMIFQLIEEGKLSLDTILAEYFPLLPNSVTITIGQLLRHESGLFDYTSDPKYTSYMYTETSRNSLLSIIQMGTPAFEPGTRADYCNTNFLLLSYIIEDLDESTYAESLKARITDSIETQSIAFGDAANTSNNDAFSYMYTGEFWQFAGETHMSIPMGAGSVVGNAADVNTFITTLLSSEKLLKHSSRDLMLTTNEERYGHGIFKLPYEELNAYGHGGSIDGFRTRTAYLMDHNLAITILSNGLNYDMAAIAKTVIDAATMKEVEIPLFSEIELSEEQLAKYSGLYTSAEIPLKITITNKEGKIVLQASGQQAFVLETDSDTEFSLAALGLIIQFDAIVGSQYQSFILRQGGGEFTFTRDQN